MYPHNADQQILPGNFFLPLGGKLSEDNRRVQLSYLIPWRRVEEEYSKHFSTDLRGERAVSVRMAFGALIIQEREGFSDRHLVQHITENPYLQYFLGLQAYQKEPPFDPSSLTHFRKRLGADVINQVNEWIVQVGLQEEEHNGDDDDRGDQPPSVTKQSDAEDVLPEQAQELKAHQGRLILDATCTPADIAYPTDLSLLHTAREKLEHIIDVLHAPLKGEAKKPRDRRQQARREQRVLCRGETPCTCRVPEP